MWLAKYGFKDFSHYQRVRGQALWSWEDPTAMGYPTGNSCGPPEVSKIGPPESNLL
ncbi:unnamed protein product, partial [Gulo gulo]